MGQRRSVNKQSQRLLPILEKKALAIGRNRSGVNCHHRWMFTLTAHRSWSSFWFDRPLMHTKLARENAELSIQTTGRHDDKCSFSLPCLCGVTATIWAKSWAKWFEFRWNSNERVRAGHLSHAKVPKILAHFFKRQNWKNAFFNIVCFIKYFRFLSGFRISLPW